MQRTNHSPSQRLTAYLLLCALLLESCSPSFKTHFGGVPVEPSVDHPAQEDRQASQWNSLDEGRRIASSPDINTLSNQSWEQNMPPSPQNKEPLSTSNTQGTSGISREHPIQVATDRPSREVASKSRKAGSPRQSSTGQGEKPTEGPKVAYLARLAEPLTPSLAKTTLIAQGGHRVTLAARCC